MKYLKKINENIDDKSITCVYSDDWTGLYCGNKLIDQGHSLNILNVLQKLGFKVNKNISIDDEEIWDEFGNHCPDDLNDIKIALKTKGFNL